MTSEASPTSPRQDRPSPNPVSTPEPAKGKPRKARKKHGWVFRALRFVVLTGFVLLAFTAAINVYMMLSTRDRILPLAEAENLDMECVMVLGAGVNRRGTPSAMLKDRLQVGLDAYRLGAAPKLLMTGDHGRLNYDEVNAMKDFAIEAGIPSSDVFMDHAGFSTYESMYRARDIFQVKKMVIVTQHYHLYRALYNADRMGIQAVGIPSDLHHYRRQTFFDAREYAARVKDFLWGIFQPYPTYLGEAIPVTGDGDLTND